MGESVSWHPFQRLNPSILVNTPKGMGHAFGVMDYGEEHDLIWVVADDETGQIWSWPNSKVRFVKNITFQRDNPEGPEDIE